MSKSVLIIDTPANCFECPCFMETGWRCQCRLDVNEDVHDGRPDWCPLAEESNTEAIPVSWVDKYLQQYLDLAGEYMEEDKAASMYGIIRINVISEMLGAWKHRDNPLYPLIVISDQEEKDE